MGRNRKGKAWRSSEEKILIDNYNSKTIFELMELIPSRSQESINNKIKRLKAEGKIIGEKDEDVIKRSYQQRDIK